MSNGEEKILSPLRKAMSELDHALPDFPYEDGHRIKDCIDKVWDEIDRNEKHLGDLYISLHTSSGRP